MSKVYFISIFINLQLIYKEKYYKWVIIDQLTLSETVDWNSINRIYKLNLKCKFLEKKVMNLV